MFDLREVQRWLIHNDAEKKAYKGFWLNIENCLKEDPEEFNNHFPEFNKHDLDVRIESVAINYRNNYPDFDYNHVIITIPIRYRKRDMGYYKLLLNFDGTADDDYFVLY